MEYKIIDSCQWTYPDIWDYPGEAKEYTGLALCGGYATFRVVIRDFDSISMETDGFEANIYEEIAIPVEENPNFEEGFAPHFPERVAPFSVYDCLKPISDKLSRKNNVTSVYVAIKVRSSDIKGNLIIKSSDIAVKIPVSVSAMGKLPEETLKIAMGYSPEVLLPYHNVTFRSEEFKKIDEEYLKMLRHQHQNRYFLENVDMYRDKNGNWHFDFTSFNNRVKQLMELGFTGFQIHGLGFRRAWDAPDIIIRGMDALSFEAYVYISQYLTAMRENLRRNGWLDGDLFYIGIADEPNQFNALTYRAVAGMVRKYLPEIKIYEAVSYIPVYGAIDVLVPRADEFQKNVDKFRLFKDNGDEIWHYVCLYPRDGGYINRFMDIPLLATRYLYWANYKFDLSGYLHWTVNCYQGDLNPYEGSCPDHINAGSKSVLPAGDDKLIYPGEKGPLMSARLEAQRESAEEYEMLRIISLHDKDTSDRICESVFRSFTDVEFDPLKFRAARNELIREYAKYC